MRNLSLASAISLIVGLAIVGCKGSGSGVDHPQKPTIETSANALTFGEVFGSGTFVNTQVVNSLTITNNGLDDLTISGVTLSGDSAYTAQGPNNSDQVATNTVKGAQSVYVQVLFQPTQLRQYSGTLTIASNADNTPSKTIALFGCGVSPGQDAGVAYCTFDAGF